MLRVRPVGAHSPTALPRSTLRKTIGMCPSLHSGSGPGVGASRACSVSRPCWPGSRTTRHSRKQGHHRGYSRVPALSAWGRLPPAMGGGRDGAPPLCQALGSRAAPRRPEGPCSPRACALQAGVPEGMGTRCSCCSVGLSALPGPPHCRPLCPTPRCTRGCLWGGGRAVRWPGGGGDLRCGSQCHRAPPPRLRQPVSRSVKLGPSTTPKP